jgi:ATPase subunit of ABC transporter with duplicated ATPase domains
MSLLSGADNPHGEYRFELSPERKSICGYNGAGTSTLIKL